ncbi:hypothetical protein IJH19_01620 [Candidatus Saccharibacteria bacterium]|nr:hypothetical protein [Candidatus Saccharibacteria bacterium]
MTKNIIKNLVDVAIEKRQDDFQSALQEGYKKGLLFDERGNYFGGSSRGQILQDEYLEYLEYLEIQKENTYKAVQDSVICHGAPLAIWIMVIIGRLAVATALEELVVASVLLFATITMTNVIGWSSVKTTVNTLTPIYRNLGVKLGKLAVNTGEDQALESRAIKLDELKKYRVAS